MALLSVFEYQRVRVGDPSCDEVTPCITRAQADFLTNQRTRLGFEVFKFVNGSAVAAQQYVGVCQIGDLTVEVLPKIDVDVGHVRKNLVAMIAATVDLAIKDGGTAYVGTQSHSILEILIRLFGEKLFAQLRRGLMRRYETREENRSVLRGRLDVVQQMRLNIGNPERLYCRYQEFLEDTPLNQVFKAALRRLLKVTRRISSQRLLAELLLMLDTVSDVPVSKLAWQDVHFDRMNERYRPSYKLAEMFLRNMLPDVTGGRHEGISLFFDMNALFEEYIGRTVQRVMRDSGVSVALQGRGGNQRYVARDSNGSGAFAMKPDIVGVRDGRYEWILDTKWKVLSQAEWREGVAQADLYQMYAYASCYDCPKVLLLYPHHDELGGEPGFRQTFYLNPWATTCMPPMRVMVASVDLRELVTVPAQLHSLLN
ncbi:McrC family protein [Niveibacterium sp. 24ML]|uniref:McrC family protein n=1 Tax=Niveibacterium sp. 24ML TaxID=2985512 RepID=UPI00227163CD|nr:McrC family protein [Niveibacterium sp. 24ML]MCX9154607.1 McrC family protein [Niveibacterium sp. 24ML]